LVLLAALALFGGWLKMPLVPALPALKFPEPESAVVWTTALMPWLGIVAAYLIYGRGADFIERLSENAIACALRRFCFNGCGFDALYNRLLVQPFLWLATVNKRDVIDFFYRDLVSLVIAGHRLLALTQNGRLRWYAAAMVCGVVAGLSWGMRP
jgi:NADH-quinone oxidoreductase subunit L